MLWIYLTGIKTFLICMLEHLLQNGVLPDYQIFTYSVDYKTIVRIKAGIIKVQTKRKHIILMNILYRLILTSDQSIAIFIISPTMETYLFQVLWCN